MINIDNYLELKNIIDREDLVIVYASSPTCGVCHSMLPRVKDLLGKYELDFYNLDISKDARALGQLSLYSVPVVIIYLKGREYHRQARFINMEELDFRLKEIVENNF